MKTEFRDIPKTKNPTKKLLQKVKEFSLETLGFPVFMAFWQHSVSGCFFHFCDSGSLRSSCLIKVARITGKRSVVQPRTTKHH